MRVPGVCGHFPTFFFNLLLLKNNNIIYNWQIKVGFWPQQYSAQNFAGIEAYDKMLDQYDELEYLYKCRTIGESLIED